MPSFPRGFQTAVDLQPRLTLGLASAHRSPVFCPAWPCPEGVASLLSGPVLSPLTEGAGAVTWSPAKPLSCPPPLPSLWDPSFCEPSGGGFAIRRFRASWLPGWLTSWASSKLSVGDPRGPEQWPEAGGAGGAGGAELAGCVGAPSAGHRTLAGHARALPSLLWFSDRSEEAAPVRVLVTGASHVRARVTRTPVPLLRLLLRFETVLDNDAGVASRSSLPAARGSLEFGQVPQLRGGGARARRAGRPGRVPTGEHPRASSEVTHRRVAQSASAGNGRATHCLYGNASSQV